MEEETLSRLAEALGSLTYQAIETRLPARLAPLRPHLEVAAAAAQAAGLEEAGALWNNLGSHLQDVADYEGARVAYERALEFFEAFEDPRTGIPRQWLEGLGKRACSFNAETQRDPSARPVVGCGRAWRECMHSLRA